MEGNFSLQNIQAYSYISIRKLMVELLRDIVLKLSPFDEGRRLTTQIGCLYGIGCNDGIDDSIIQIKD